MPKEVFYPTDPDHDGPNPRVEVAWHKSYAPAVWVTALHTMPDGVVVPIGIDLDRSGLNRLIKTLRKARDQVHGADE